MLWKGRTGSGRVSTIGGKGIAAGGLGFIALLAYTLLTGDPTAILFNLFNQGGETKLSEARVEELTEFVSVVLADTETVWNEVFALYDKDYSEPYLVIFSGSIDSACGNASSSTGPFYCPGDEKIYIDLIFFDELENEYDAPGDFAMAYVIAHEVGHHVQNQLGILKQIDELQETASETESNELSVRLELQADYLAGVWAHYVQGYGYLEEGDFEEALGAASAVGDDTIQKESQGYVVPESFTHGTSEQRMGWFKKGFEFGDLDHGDTFNATTLYLMMK